MDNFVMLVGNVTDDPELRYTPNGHAVSNFSIAINKRKKDESGEWVDDGAEFFRITAWRGLAENIAESVVKGTRVLVTGKLRQNSWETPEGEKRTSVEVDADEVTPSLRWATASVTRNKKE